MSEDRLVIGELCECYESPWVYVWTSREDILEAINRAPNYHHSLGQIKESDLK